MNVVRRLLTRLLGRQRSSSIKIDTVGAAPDPISQVNAINPILIACARLADFEVLQPYLQRGGFRPLALLRDAAASDDQVWPSEVPVFKGASTAIPVLPLNDLQRLRNDVRYDRIPIVIADTGDGMAFRSLGPRIAEMIGENQRLLHPAFLARPEFVTGLLTIRTGAAI